MSYFEKITDIVCQYKHLGEKKLGTGAVLIGHVPHVAPEAWLHSLFPPLSYEDIEVLEKEVQHDMPMPYKDFLLHYGNGIRLFSDTFNLYGLRKILGRSMEAIRQPYSLDTPNTIERPKKTKDEYLFIGGYSYDGSKVYIDGTTNKVYYCARRDATPVYEWDNFEEMLVSEVVRIQKHFDSEGRRIDKSVPTVPILIK